MANRIVNNVVIVDSAMGNSFVLNSGGQILNISELKVATIAFWSSDTTGVCRLSAINTTDCIIQLTNPNNNGTTVGAVMGGVNFQNLKIPTLTAGTAWIYLK